jgi:ABC-type sugar transport system substrate-binding protein
MKKVLALLLVLCMAFSLFACGGGTDNSPDTSSPDASTPGTESPDESPAGTGSPVAPPETPTTGGETGSQPLDQVGFFDRDFDYNQNPRYKFMYVCIGWQDLNADFNSSFEHWATLANVEYGGYFSAASNEELLTQLPTLKDQGVDGVLLDPDMMQYEQIAEVCDRVGLQWIGCMGQALKFDADGMPAGLIHPFVGFDMVALGYMIGERLIKYAGDNWGVPLEEIGFIGCDMTTSFPLHQRVEGSQAAWAAAGGPAENFMIVDTDMTTQTTQNVVEAQIALNPQLEYWLIIGVVEDVADGAANAIDNVFGNPDNACIATVGGKKLATKWDEGIESAWRYVLDTPTPVYAEALFFALYAFVNGDATPETIWPSWVDHNPASVPFFGETYAQLRLPSVFQDHDNYKRMLTWANLYTESSIYPYNEPGVTLDDFPGRGTIPDSYKG